MNKSFCPWSVHEQTTTVTANDREGYRSTLNVVFCKCYRCWGWGGSSLGCLLWRQIHTRRAWVKIKGIGNPCVLVA